MTTACSKRHRPTTTRLYLDSMFGGSNSNKNTPSSSSSQPRGAASNDNVTPPPPQLLPTEDAALIEIAQRVIRADLGIADPSLLDDERFCWITNTAVADVPLSKLDYVAAGRFFNLRGAFPDLEYRAHDFRVVDGTTVRCTCRVTGTMRGALRLRGADEVVLPPTGKVMKCPPEGVSIDIDPETGKVIKICSGFCLDRCVGNTNGLTGVQAASIIAGKDISAFENLPVTTVLSSIVSRRPAKKVTETTNFLAPFPSTVMIQLAKGVLFTKMGYDDPTLLSVDFEYITPFTGPIRKRAFLESYAAQELAGYYPNFRNFRVDPYEPTRVWVDLQPTADDYVGHPQCMSLTFDDDGYCTRVTSSAILDPSIGNAGGLGGPEGLKYARGEASAGVSARPLPRVLGRLRKRAFSSLTGVGVDEYQAPSNGVTKSSTTTKKKMTPEPPSVKPKVPPVASKKATTPTPPAKKKQTPQKQQPNKKAPPARQTSIPPKAKSLFEPKSNPPATKSQKPKEDSEIVKRLEKLKRFSDSIRINPEKQKSSPTMARSEDPKEDSEIVKRLEKLKEFSDSIRIIPEQISRSFSLRPTTPREKPPEPTRKDAKRVISDRLASLKRKDGAPKVVNGAGPTNGAKPLDPKVAEAKKLELARKIQAERREKMAQTERERLIAKAKERREAAKATQGRREESTLSNFASSATLSILGNRGNPKTSAKTDLKTTAKMKVAPAGVPTLSRWRRNSDQSVSGLVKGSRSFDDGSRVTTSPIETGTIASGEVVRTGSGSRYFLE